MGIIYIGDRSVGKTHLAMELANPRNECVRVLNPNYDSLKALLYDSDEESTKATDASKEVDPRNLEIQVKLPASSRQISVKWVDTPGEIWRKAWQETNPDKWRNFLNTVRQSEGILLILPPYREILKTEVSVANYQTRQQWCNRFERWVEFFRYDCPKARHIVICLNKADLLACDIQQIASKLAFNPRGPQITWQQRHDYVYNHQFFEPIQSQIEQIGQSTTGLHVRCFITSIHNRSLLELPWIYLAAFLAK